MATNESLDTTATVIIGQKVRPGCESAFEEWQKDLNHEAAAFPGFIGAEINPPTAVQPDWVVVYRFDSIAHVLAWQNSAVRQDRLARGAQYFDGPATQQVLGGRAQHRNQLVTVTVSHRISPENVDDFLAWQERLRQAESGFSGFRGSEIFRPVADDGEDWTTLYRFDSAAELEKWLNSDERRLLLAEGAKFSDFQTNTINSSFGSWFSFDNDNPEIPPPSKLKEALAVWVGLYPTVVLLALALSPLHMPLWIGMLVGNLLSSVLMGFITMPRYVNPLLKSWLYPTTQAHGAKTNWRGGVIIATAMGSWAVLFYVVTRVLWHLP